ncbi:hypothetical protein EW145_g1186 [Phellinidium pouzarii]|uniref:Uncharacterized protein n=1 Tax=Phellinidium pouzarii TaxID=167371 RepID=A0A4S4LG02_9AGAM|nr:hypothetical protein EW145_g1186 [Phellinidium pouzarii]
MLDDDETVADTFGDRDAELRDLLGAVVLYRRIFPSKLLNVSAGENGLQKNGNTLTARGVGLPPISIALTPMPSPPPSPSRRNAVLHIALRRSLDSAAFDRGDALEDARDRVVDLLTAEAAGWPARLKY